MKMKLLILGNIIGMAASLLYTVYIVGNLLPAFAFLLTAIGEQSDAGAIGIIGGADGPTAIFLSSSCGPLPLIFGPFVLMIFLSGIFLVNVLYFLKKKQ